jgi:glycosyltransferase involved in cell wall biosynthesis
MKILMIAGDAQSLVNFRGDLIILLRERGHVVVVCAPRLTAETVAFLREHSILYYDYPELKRSSLSPFADAWAARRLRQIVREVSPDSVFAYTIKPIILGISAAAACGVARRISLITGLGAAFNTPGLRGYCLKMVASILYRRALGKATSVIVQNKDIGEALRTAKIVSPGRRIVVVDGSGVNTARFSLAAPPDGSPIFLLLGRLLYDKGIKEFAEAAAQLKPFAPHARFVLAGGIDSNPSAIPSSQIDQWVSRGAIEYLGEVRDVVSLLRRTSVLVHPSYHEGVPRAVLEAMATGRPIVTTDAIGCRETIADAGPPDNLGLRVGVNGILVPVRNTEALVEALRRLVINPRLRESMGVAARELAVRRFDVKIINAKMLEILESDGHHFPCTEHLLS